MINSLKISGFKNFKGKSVELTDLKRVNLLVGMNGSGKSSVLELLALASRFPLVNADRIPSEALEFYEFDSLFGPTTSISLNFDGGAVCTYTISDGKKGRGWKLVKEGAPDGSIEVAAVWKIKQFSDMSEPSENKPFSGIKVFPLETQEIIDHEAVQNFLKDINPSQRIFKTSTHRGDDYYTEDQGEIWPDRLAGGSQYLAMLFRAIRLMPSGRQSNILLIDDLGDSIFPALRKSIIPKLNEKLDEHPDSNRAQMFATTHNIEIVKSALDHPEYCNVYMFDYDGLLVEFEGTTVKRTESSSGIKSVGEISLIAKMLGFTDIELGFPELVIFSEEETKRTFLNALKKNSNMQNQLKDYEVHVPFQPGDGNTSNAINNLLDLSKYFSFSEIWSDRYAIFVDYNEQDYDTSGNARDDSLHRKALKKCQDKLVLGSRFILTKKDNLVVKSMEETYPNHLWEEFKKQKNINVPSVKEWLENMKERGKSKNELAEFIGTAISLEDFRANYPELSQLISK